MYPVLRIFINLPQKHQGETCFHASNSRDILNKIFYFCVCLCYIRISAGLVFLLEAFLIYRKLTPK